MLHIKESLGNVRPFFIKLNIVGFFDHQIENLFNEVDNPDCYKKLSECKIRILSIPILVASY